MNHVEVIMSYRWLCLALCAILSFGFSQESNAASKYKHCIRMSFAGDHMGLMTNMCNKALYVDWVDFNGTHTTAIGKNQVGRNIGRIIGAFQVNDASLQNDLSDKSNDRSSTKHTRGSSSSTLAAQRGDLCYPGFSKCADKCNMLEDGRGCQNACENRLNLCNATGNPKKSYAQSASDRAAPVSRSRDYDDDDDAPSNRSSTGGSYRVQTRAYSSTRSNNYGHNCRGLCH